MAVQFAEFSRHKGCEQNCQPSNNDPYRKLVFLACINSTVCWSALHKLSACACVCVCVFPCPCVCVYSNVLSMYGVFSGGCLMLRFKPVPMLCRCCLLEIHYLAAKCFKSSENNSEGRECSPGWRLLLSTPLTPAGLGLHSLSLICWSPALRPLHVCVCVCTWSVQVRIW